MRISAGLQWDTVYSSTVIFQCHFQLKPQGRGCWSDLAAPGIINMRWGGAADKYEGGGGAAWLSAGRHINHHVSPSSSSSRWRHFSCIAFQPTVHYIVASCGLVHFWRSSQNQPGVDNWFRDLQRREVWKQAITQILLSLSHDMAYFQVSKHMATWIKWWTRSFQDQ